MNIKVIMAMLTLSLWSCSTGNLRSDHRHPASVNKEACSDLLRSILDDSPHSRLRDTLETYLKKRFKREMRRHDHLSLWRQPFRLLTGTRRYLVKHFRNLNSNKMPVIYIDDDDQTLVTLMKYSDIFKRQIPADEFDETQMLVFDNVDQWIKRYGQYHDDMVELINEHLTLRFAIQELKRFKRSWQSPDQTIDILYDVDNQYITRKSFEDIKDLEQYIDILIDKKRSITWDSPLFREYGKLTKLEIQHAMDHERLKKILSRLKNFQHTDQANGRESPQRLLDKIQEIETLLKERPDLTPSPRYQMYVEQKALIEEVRELFKNVSESNSVRMIGNIYKTLDEGDRRYFGLDDYGLSGRVITVVQKSRWYILGSLALGTGTAAINYFEEIKEFFTSDYKKRLRCIQQEKDNKFAACAAQYLKEEFSEQNTLTFIFQGEEALLNILQQDLSQAEAVIEQMMEDEKRRMNFLDRQTQPERHRRQVFLLELLKFAQERKDWLREQELNNQISTELNRLFEKIINEDDTTTAE